MKTYILDIKMIGWEGMPLLKQYKVRANSFAMAAGFCKGQAALQGWKVLDIIDHQIIERV
jgi:hypothetical protein